MGATEVPANAIVVRGVEVHNLKQVDLDLPHEKWIVFCGPSGSGKTSLAIDTLYAEGQRRYVESFSTYTRQFLERLDKPAAERIDGIPAAVAVTHGKARASHRATVGTITDIADYLRLLFAKIGRVVCSQCGRDVAQDSPQSVADRLHRLPDKTRYLVAFSPTSGDRTAETMAASLKENGFLRVMVHGQMVDLNRESIAADADLSRLLVVVDRLAAGVDVARVRDSVETAFRHGEGRAVLLIAVADATEDDAIEKLGARMEFDGRPFRRWSVSERMACDDCEIEYPKPEPRLYSFNSPLGACGHCEGLGHETEDGVMRVCSECHGTRLCPEALGARVGGKHIAEIAALRIDACQRFLQQLTLSEEESQIGRRMLDAIQARLGYLNDVGLHYLSLDRSLPTLSAGESQRVALTSALGSSLVNMLYVLDEPSMGLHAHDVAPLIEAIRGLRDRGNTVVVVEHQASILRAADHIVEFGPGAGEQGGRVVFQGTPREMEDSKGSVTGDYLAGRRGMSQPPERREPNHGWIRLTGARGNNLGNLTVEFPLGVLCLVTGVSGAGKSTLVQETLYPALCQRMRKKGPEPLDYDDLLGDGQLDHCVAVDQSPIGRSPRSNPVTYLKAFDEIRAVFADTVEARVRNLSAGHFSFNVEGGRCEHCRGNGVIEIDMQFLADVTRTCPECYGTRYRPEILDITVRGRNIAQVLDLTVREAFLFFRGRPKVQARLKRLIDVGLDYLRLGQAANTLSGGESQRLKLAAYTASAPRGRTLFLLDEPTSGLHFSDVVQLLDCFDALLAVGHSLIVVEHNAQVMKAADYVIDLGPGAAEEGGRVVACGTPEEVAQEKTSPTGRLLAEIFSTPWQEPTYADPIEEP